METKTRKLGIILVSYVSLFDRGVKRIYACIAMIKSEIIMIRVRPVIRNWLKSYEKAMSKNTSEIIRDLLENSFRQYKSQYIGKRLNKRLEKRASSLRGKMRKILDSLSNIENQEAIIKTIIGLEDALRAWDIHLTSLGNEIIGKKEKRKGKRVRAKAG